MAKRIKRQSIRKGTPRPGNGGKRPGAGRPKSIPEEEKSAIEKARADGRAAMPEIMRVQIAYARAGSTRAAEFVANRSGMPPEMKIDGPTATAALGALVKSLASELPDEDPEP